MPAIILSMTTIPSRIDTVLPQTVRSLAQQSIKFDELNIFVETNHVQACAQAVARVQAHLAVPIRVRPLIHDPGPVAKVSAALDGNRSAEDLIITVDDDQIYQPTWLETLTKYARRPGFGNAAIGLCSWNVSGFLTDPDQGYYTWPTRQDAGEPYPTDVLEGYSGVVYRAGFFDEDILCPPEAFKLVDDVWISSYLRRRGIKRFVVGHGKMCENVDEALPGLHTRADFVALNRRAAVIGFSALRQPKLSITICSLHGAMFDRSTKLTRLYCWLAAQRRSDEVELLVASDAGQIRTGFKRSALYQAAQGDYVVCVDDDDWVSLDYIPKILAAIDQAQAQGQSPDVIVLRGKMTKVDANGYVQPNEPTITFDYKVGLPNEAKADEDGVLWRSPGHLCPVRRELAVATTFPAVTRGEDIAWSALMQPILKTEARAGAPGEILYQYYLHDTKRTPRVAQ